LEKREEEKHCRKKKNEPGNNNKSKCDGNFKPHRLIPIVEIAPL